MINYTELTRVNLKSIEKPTQSRSPEQRITLVKRSLYCILKVYIYIYTGHWSISDQRHTERSNLTDAR